MSSFADWTKVCWKYLLSFRKKEWGVDDYPVRLRHTPVDRTVEYGRWKPIEWSAQIINWYTIQGDGDSPAEALASLRQKLEDRRAAGRVFPRPGTGLPIEFAPSHRISEHPDIGRDFFLRILDLHLDECFISDQSSLWDFHGSETNDELNEKILLTYGVDVSDIESGNLAEIFERLVARGVTADPGSI